MASRSTEYRRRKKQKESFGVEDGSIDAGLFMLSMLPPPVGKRWSAYDIADACGVSHTTIFNIERRAIAKLKAAMAERGINNIREIGVLA